eukprot:3821072-Amphidinium_carterae.1
MCIRDSTTTVCGTLSLSCQHTSKPLGTFRLTPAMPSQKVIVAGSGVQERECIQKTMQLSHMETAQVQ